MTELRKDRRAPASLKVKYKSATVDEFIEQFGTDVSRGGIFIKTKKPLDTGALLKFEFQLQDGSAVIHGVGRVAWRRLEQHARPDMPAGMGIKFFKLSDHSRAVVERMESRHAGPSRYEQTDAAEFAPPLSTAPSFGESGAHAHPGNGPRGAGSGPLTMPPPPASSSKPPALAEVPPARAASPRAPAPPARGAARSGAGAASKATSTGSVPKGALGAPKGALGAFTGANQPPSSLPGGLPAQRAGRDPASVDLARELFGDFAESAQPSVSSPAAPRPISMAPHPQSLSARAAAAAAALHAGSRASVRAPSQHAPPQAGPSAREPLDGGPAEPTAPRGGSAESLPAARSRSAWERGRFDSPVPPIETPRPAPSTRSSRASFANKVPSIEQLVEQAVSGSAQPPAEPISAVFPGASGSLRAAASSARAVGEPGEGAPAEEAPLTLAMGRRSLPPTAAQAAQPAGRSPWVLISWLVTTVLLLALVGFFFWQRQQATPAEVSNTVARAPAGESPTPAQPPAAPAAPSNTAPTPEPAAAPVADVELSITSVPRGAEVLMSGNSLGTTPFKIALPANAPVQLEVKSPGYGTLQRTVTPGPGAAAENFELPPLDYELILETDPAGASVTANKQTQVAPAPLKLGHLDAPLSVTIDKTGFQRATRTLPLDEWKLEDGVMRARISLSLTPLPPPAGARRRAAPAARPALPQAPPEPNAAPAAAPAESPPVMQVKPESEPKPEPPAPAPQAADPAPPEPPATE